MKRYSYQVPILTYRIPIRNSRNNIVSSEDILSSPARSLIYIPSPLARLRRPRTSSGPCRSISSVFLLQVPYTPLQVPCRTHSVHKATNVSNAVNAPSVEPLERNKKAAGINQLPNIQKKSWNTVATSRHSISIEPNTNCVNRELCIYWYANKLNILHK